MAVRRKQINALVQQILRQHGIQKTPVPIEKIARSSGAELHKESAEANLSGFLVRDLEKRRVIIGVNSDHHKNRQRFTIAHELGHFLLHEGQTVHIDREDRAFQIKLRDSESSKGTDDEEKEANLFAAELLMPEAFLEKDLNKLGEVDLLDDEDVLSELAKKYQVSTQALTFRLAYLGYISL